MKVVENIEYTINASYLELDLIYDALRYFKHNRDTMTKSMADHISEMIESIVKYL